MTGSYVQSLLSGKVIEIRDKSAQAGAFLDAGVMKLSFIYPPTAEQQQEIGYQLWNLSDPVGGSRFIESYLNSNLVIAITGGAIDSEFGAWSGTPAQYQERRSLATLAIVAHFGRLLFHSKRAEP